MNSPSRAALALSLAILALAGCDRSKEGAGGSAGSGNVIRIGHVAPLSGGTAHLGKDNENGARLAVEEINAAGGVKVGDKAYQLELLAEDDKGDPREATLAAQKLVDSGVVAVVGHLNSGCSIPASQIYNAAGIVQVSPSSTAVKYTHQGYKSTFRIVANDGQQGGAMGNYAVDGLKAKTVAIIDDQTQYGQGLAAEVENRVKARGLTVVDREYTNDKASDFNAILTKVRGAHPDVIVYGGMDATAGPLTRQARQLGIKSDILTGDGACSPEYIHLAAEAAEGTICTQAGEAVSKLARGDQFVARYKARFGTDVQIYSPYSYDAVYVIADAIHNAGSLDRAAIAAQVAKTDYNGLTGHIVFDENGDLKAGAVSVFQVHKGQLEYLSTSR